MVVGIRKRLLEQGLDAGPDTIAWHLHHHHAVAVSRATVARLLATHGLVKVGTGIGAGVMSGGRLHRGAQGSAGDIGHVAVMPDVAIPCRCGKLGCLEAIAGGAAIARQGLEAARDGRSPRLTAALAEDREISAADVGAAAAHGDPTAVEILTGSARFVGETVARIVNFFNPSLIVLGGGVAASSDAYTATRPGSGVPAIDAPGHPDLRILRSPRRPSRDHRRRCHGRG